MKRNIEFPIKHLDWYLVKVITPWGVLSIKEIIHDLEEMPSTNQFAIGGTGTVASYLIYFEDPNDAVWLALRGWEMYELDPK